MSGNYFELFPNQFVLVKNIETFLPKYFLWHAQDSKLQQEVLSRTHKAYTSTAYICREIWISHTSTDEDCCLMGYDTVQIHA